MLSGHMKLAPTMRTAVTNRNSHARKSPIPARLSRFSISAVSILTAAIALLVLILRSGACNAASHEELVCDIAADFALGHEDYAAAITLHRRFLRSSPENALAHFHLGFAYGMIGRGSEEVGEYLKAAGLGLREWDLFLDLGLAYLDQRDYSNAVNALETAVSLGPQHPEAHFNLALAYEKADRLNDSMKEITASLQEAPNDPDVGNTKAIICAELGDRKCARDEWALLQQVAPNYAPARTNLAILAGAAPESRSPFPNAVEIPQLVATKSWSSDKPMVIPVQQPATSEQSPGY